MLSKSNSKHITQNRELLIWGSFLELNLTLMKGVSYPMSVFCSSQYAYVQANTSFFIYFCYISAWCLYYSRVLAHKTVFLNCWRPHLYLETVLGWTARNGGFWKQWCKHPCLLPQSITTYPFLIHHTPITWPFSARKTHHYQWWMQYE